MKVIHWALLVMLHFCLILGRYGRKETTSPTTIKAYACEEGSGAVIRIKGPTILHKLKYKQNNVTPQNKWKRPSSMLWLFGVTSTNEKSRSFTHNLDQSLERFIGGSVTKQVVKIFD